MQYEVILGVIVAGFCVLYYLKTRLHGRKFLEEQVIDYEALIKLEKQEVNRWKGKYNARNIGPKIEKSVKNGEEELDLEKIIPQLAQNYLPNAPTWLKPLIQDPEALRYLIQLAKEHPEQAKSLLGRFIGKKASGDAVQPELPGL